MRMWIKDPLAIFADGAERGLVVEGARIAERVGRGATPERIDAVFDAARHVVLPGLVNTHHHFFQTLTRAHPSAINKPLFPWLLALYPIWARLKPNHLRLASRLALTELMLSGCTTAADHHYLYPAGLENAVDIEVEEARALGMRMTVSRGSMNLSEKDGGLPPDSVVQDEETILADSERVLKLFHDPKPGAKVRVALAPCSPFSISKRLMSESARLAQRYDCAASYPPVRNRRRGAVLPQDVWPEAGRSPGGDGLDVGPRLARAWRSFQCRRDRAAGQGECRRQPLRGLEHGARLGDLPDMRARGRRRAGGLGGRRLGVQRFLQHDGGGAARADDRPPALRRRQGHPSRRPALGDAKARRAASGAPTSAGSRRVTRRIWRCLRSTSRASRARTIRSPRSFFAARIGRIAS